MSVSEELIMRLTNSLEADAQRGEMTGNRMHHPMLVCTNGENAKRIFAACEKKFKRIWPQTYGNMAFVSCSSSETAQFTDLKNDSAVSVSELQSQLDDIRSAREEAFADRTEWRFYNIIDTSTVKGLDEFKRLYELLNDFEQMAQTNVSSMLIVILDETLENIDFAKTVREFLYNAENESSVKYNGTVVFSNQKITRSLVRNSEELYGIAAGLIYISNNDAVSGHDDADYAERVNCLFSNRLTLSHSLQKKPDEEISILLVDHILQKADRMLQEKSSIDLQKWKEILGISNAGRIDYITQRFNAIRITLNADELQYLPFKTIPSFKGSIAQISFTTLKTAIFEGTFEDYVDKTCKQIGNGSEVEQILEDYENEVKFKVSSKDCETLTDAMIEDIADSVICSKPDENKTVEEYFNGYVLDSFIKEVFKPFLKKMLWEMRDQAKPTIERFNKFNDDFDALRPISGFDPKMQGIYIPVADNYLNTDDGVRSLHSLVAPGNNECDFAEQLKKIVLKIVDKNEGLFRISYIDWMGIILKHSGEEIYRVIRSNFDSDLTQNVYLYGEFPKKEQIKVFAFHTSDAQGNNKTAFFKSCLDAYRDEQHIQFMNTGLDDEIEAFRFLDLNDKSIIM